MVRTCRDSQMFAELFNSCRVASESGAARAADHTADWLETQPTPVSCHDDLTLVVRQLLQRGHGRFGVESVDFTFDKPALRPGHRRLASVPPPRALAHVDRTVADNAVEPGDRVGRRRALPH